MSTISKNDVKKCHYVPSLKNLIKKKMVTSQIETYVNNTKINGIDYFAVNFQVCPTICFFSHFSIISLIPRHY